MSTPSGFTALLAQNIQDSTGTPLAAGTLSVQPTDAYDNPIAASAGGANGGLITVKPVSFPVTAGELPGTAWVPDVSLTRPQYISYRFTVRNALGEPLLILRNVQPDGPSLNLDTYTPIVPAQAPNSQGPAGPQGPPGSMATLPDSATGALFNLAIINGALEVIPSGCLAGLFLVDEVGGAHYSVLITAGQIVIAAVQLLTTPVAPVLIDTVTEQLFSLVILNGAVDVVPGGLSAGAVSQLSIFDTSGSGSWLISVANGQLTVNPAS
jgi:hypothetical protein